MKDIIEERKIEFIQEAIRARRFSETETLEMGFKLIEFALKFKGGCKECVVWRKK